LNRSYDEALTNFAFDFCLRRYNREKKKVKVGSVSGKGSGVGKKTVITGAAAVGIDG
jgi:hypothetical protein